MWYLQNLKDANLRLSLPPGRDLVVGRKDCDLLIPDDKSISRRHALIHVNTNSRTSPVFLTDCKSKFGTVLGERRLSAGEKVEISAGAVVKFGQGPASSKFRVIFEPIVVCCSTLSVADKLKVKQLAKDLGGRMVGSWNSDCSHLVMSSLTVTVKVVCALACCKPVVTVGWLEEALRSVSDHRMLPCTSQYLPPIVDEEVKRSEVSFAPNLARSLLFHDRVFYFFNKDQMANLHTCVTSSDARCQLIDKPESISLEMLVVKESIVIALKNETGSMSEREWVGQVTNFLNSHDLRVIAESEIGFALLHVSRDTYCNPKSEEGIQDADISMAAPSLSQMASTQITQSQVDPSHITTQSQAGLPPTPISSLTSATVLAPNSQLSTQSSVNKGGSGATQTESNVKVKGNNRLTRSKAPKTPSNANTSTEVKEGSVKSKPITRASTTQKITDFIKPTLPVSPHGPSQHPPTKRVKSETETNIIELSQQTCSREEIEDSQPNSQRQSKKLSALSLKSPMKKSSIVYHSQDALASQSVESNTSAAADVSVLAPNSLTPGSTQKKSSGKTTLPGASFMSGLFGNKKRKASREVDDTNSDRPTKVRKASQSGEIHNRKDDVLQDSSKEDFAPKLELLEDLPEREDTNSEEMEQIETDTVTKVRSKIPRLISNSQLTQGPQATSTQAAGPKTPKRQTKVGVSPIVSTTSFISTRKRKKNESELDTSKIPAMTFSEAADRNASLFSHMQATQDLLSPFTQLTSTSRVAVPASIFTTTGKRSKANPIPKTEADVLWLEEEDPGEGENPLGTQYDDTRPRKQYKPVLTEQGFIKARVKPRLEASRIGRFARMANSEYLREDTPPNDSVDMASQECRPLVCCPVEIVSLVIVGSGQIRLEETDDRQNGQRKNFKKFRKVRNAGTDCVPRFPTLTRYIPPSATGVTDWTVMDEPGANARQSSEREEESQDSQNIFTLPKARREKRK